MRKTKFLSLLMLMALFASIFQSCESDSSSEPQAREIDADVLSKLAVANFEISSVKPMTMFGESGVAVEDMFFTFDQIDELGESQNIPNTEHYRTSNLVTSLPRVITISVDPDLGSLGSNALNDAILMYNSVSGLRLTFQRVAFGQRGRNKADIEVTAFSEQPSGGFITLGRAAGFPTRKGDPAKGFGINTVWFDLLNPSQSEVAGTMAHEVGHCIGLRHTDYQTRESCGQNINEGSAGVGAIYIDGTPTGSDPTSLMQSCGPANTFNNNDKTALQVIY